MARFALAVAQTENMGVATAGAWPQQPWPRSRQEGAERLDARRFRREDPRR